MAESTRSFISPYKFVQYPVKCEGTLLESIYPTDNMGTMLKDIPMMDSIKNYNDIDFIYVVADNGIVDYWMSIVNAQYNIKVGAGVTAVMAPKFFAYINSGQMTGMLGGMKGAADYEKLVGKPFSASKGMAAQSLVHLFIIFSVITGNIIFFVGGRKKTRAVN